MSPFKRKKDNNSITDNGLQGQNFFGTYIKYVSQSILGLISFAAFIFADTFFMALGGGELGLAALNISIPIYSFLYSLGLLMGLGSATIFAIARASNNKKEADSIFTQSIEIGLLICCVIIAIGIFFSRDISFLIGADQTTIDGVNIYIKIIMICSPFFMLNNILMPFIRNDGKPGISMTAMIIASLVNIVLDYLFIVVFQMGIMGAAIATTCAPISGILISSIHFIRKDNTFRLVKVLPTFNVVRKIIRLGISFFITEFSNGILILFFNVLIINIAGNTGVAAYSIVANIALIAITIFSGISQGIQPLVSNAYGQKNLNRINQILSYALSTVAFLGMGVYILSHIFAPQLTGIFNTDNNLELGELATKGIKLYFIGLPFAGFNIVLASFFSNITAQKPALIISLLRGLLLIIPVVVVLSWLIQMDGIWLSFPTTETIVVLISFYFYRNYKNKLEMQTDLKK